MNPYEPCLPRLPDPQDAPDVERIYECEECGEEMTGDQRLYSLDSMIWLCGDCMMEVLFTKEGLEKIYSLHHKERAEFFDFIAEYLLDEATAEDLAEDEEFRRNFA